jgi:voltage-gated potassium channel
MQDPYRPAESTVVRRLLFSLLAIVVVTLAGTLGYIGFGFSPLDALFQTVITVTTVGFGEVHSFTPGEEAFTIGLILLGVGFAAYALSVLIEFFIEGYLGGSVRRKRMESRIRAMRDHIILCGWGRVGRAIAHNLSGHGSDVVVIDISPQRIATVQGPSVCGDATDEDVLRAAGIHRARIMITALQADADNLYVTLTARSMCPGLFIVSRAAAEQAVPKLVQAGADRVVNPQDLGGARMAALAVQPDVAEFLDVVMHDGSLEFRLEQVEVPLESPLAGRTLRETKIHAVTGTLVLAMREPGGSFRTNPSPLDTIAGGEVLIVIGDESQVARLRAMAAGPAGTGPAARA